MKKETIQKVLGESTERADIKVKGNKTINFGFDVKIIVYEKRYFYCIGSEYWDKIQIKYSEVKSIEVFK